MAGLDALAAGLDGDDAAVADLELLDAAVHPHLAAVGDDLVGHRLPHLARAEARVVELLDQRLDLVALVAEERGLGGRHEGEALDPLGGPLGAQLGRRDAPDLLGVGLEEVLVEPLAEAVGDPLLEVLLLALGLHRGPEVGEAGADELDRAELADHVHAVERVLEELAVPEDARLARALEELLLHHLVPEVVDLLGLGEEAVAAEVEAVAVADLGLGDAARPGPPPRRRSRGCPCGRAGSPRSGRRGRRRARRPACGDRPRRKRHGGEDRTRQATCQPPCPQQLRARARA